MTILTLMAAVAGDILIVMAPGTQATVSVADDRLTASAPAKAPLTDFDREVANMLRIEGCTDQNCGPNARAITTGEVASPRSPAAANTVRVRFAQLNNHSVLVFENGFGEMLTYRARITVKGKSTVTDVCQILPGKAGVEHWPYPVERIELSGFSFESWDGTTPPRCT